MPKLALLVLVVACSSKAPPASPPGSGSGGTGSSEVGSGSSAGAGSGSATATCGGDHHCCQPDGTIVEATCSPVVKKDSDSIARGPDGKCAPCMLRCLPPATRIRTPSGDVAVDRLKAGDLVMTIDASGLAIAVPIVRVRAIPVAGPHAIVAVALADGRTLRASPLHPTATGGTLGALVTGDRLDGAEVVSVRSEPFSADATWDLLPAGPTGAYWADGVLVGSTLR
jgi:hypothetical protein